MAGARPDTWMPLYWGDYAKDTGHLSATHHGAYLMLLKHYWVTGAPLPNDDSQLWRIACADSLAHWRKIKPVVLAFFTLEDGRLRHGRVEKELSDAVRHAERRTGAARRASEARWGTQSESDAKRNASRMPDGMRGQCPPPSPSPSQGLTTTESVANTARAGASQPRSTLISDEWEPGEAEIAALKAERPDMTEQVIAERMRDFRDWCAANATRTFNPAATWRGFMRKTKRGADSGGETWDQRRIREAREAVSG